MKLQTFILGVGIWTSFVVGQTEIPNLDCDTYFGDAETLLEVQMVKVGNHYKMTLTNKATREELVLYQNVDTLSALMTIQQDTTGKGTSSLCDDEMLPWKTAFTKGGKNCSFHENLWPPINSQAVRTTIYQHLYATFSQEEGLGSQLGTSFQFNPDNALIPVLLGIKNGVGHFDHVLNTVPVWKSVKPLIEEVERKLIQLGGTPGPTLLSVADGILELTGDNGRTPVYLSGEFGEIVQESYNRISVPNRIWKIAQSSPTHRCGVSVAIWNCYDEICTTNDDDIVGCTVEKCVTLFGSEFTQNSKHCCGNLTIAEEMIARIDPSFVLYEDECDPEESTTTPVTTDQLE